MTLAFVLLLIAPLLCQSCSSQEEKCPQDTEGYPALPHFVQEHVKELSKIWTTLPYTSETVIAFLMSFERPGRGVYCMETSTDYYRTSIYYACRIKFPKVILHFQRVNTINPESSEWEPMAVALDEVRAYAEVTSMSPRGRNPYAYKITGLDFPNLSDDLLKTVAGNQTSDWQAYFMKNARRFASQAYAEGNSAKCFL